MSNYNTSITPMETTIKLKKGSFEEYVYRTLYKQIIGSLRYLFNTRPYICHGVGLVTMLMEKPRLCHFLIAKRILRYIRGTTNHGI